MAEDIGDAKVKTNLDDEALTAVGAEPSYGRAPP